MFERCLGSWNWIRVVRGSNPKPVLLLFPPVQHLSYHYACYRAVLIGSWYQPKASKNPNLISGMGPHMQSMQCLPDKSSEYWLKCSTHTFVLLSCSNHEASRRISFVYEQQSLLMHSLPLVEACSIICEQAVRLSYTALRFFNHKYNHKRGCHAV